MLRKPLVLALLAAGIIANDGLPEAQSTIFVPELAMLDGTLCVPNAASARCDRCWWRRRRAPK